MALIEDIELMKVMEWFHKTKEYNAGELSVDEIEKYKRSYRRQKELDEDVSYRAFRWND